MATLEEIKDAVLAHIAENDRTNGPRFGTPELIQQPDVIALADNDEGRVWEATKGLRATGRAFTATDGGLTLDRTRARQTSRSIALTFKVDHSDDGAFVLVPWI